MDYDISAYTVGPLVDETFSQVSSSGDYELSSVLPTVFSPTPSWPTTVSPQSAATLAPAYYEIYKVSSLRMIDDSSSSTIPSFTFNDFPRSSTPNDRNCLPDDRSDASSVFASSTQTQVSVRNFSKRQKRHSSHSLCKVFMLFLPLKAREHERKFSQFIA